MLEGTQGYALSLNHGPYPYCTSRDVLASSLLSDIGLAPSMCTKVILVVRTYPIRVAGNSGPMCGNEITWKEVQKRSHYPRALIEKTTVTKRVRRVCEFDVRLIKEACLVNRPTELAVTFADYLDYKNYGKTKYEQLTPKSRQWIENLEQSTGVPVTLVKTGINWTHIIDRRKEIYDEGIESIQ